MEFKDRLIRACNANTIVPPYGGGRQSFIARQLNVSQEATRKWFSGESKPRAAMMKKLSALLGVEHVWLALGTDESETNSFRQVAKIQDAGIYAFTSYLIANGWSVAFTTDVGDMSHITTTYNGVVTKFMVTSGVLSNERTVELEPVTVARGCRLIAAVENSRPKNWGFDFVDMTDVEPGDIKMVLTKKNDDVYTLDNFNLITM